MAKGMVMELILIQMEKSFKEYGRIIALSDSFITIIEIQKCNPDFA